MNIAHWLLHTAADLLDTPIEELDQDRPLVEFGFSSRTAVAFSGLVADRFGVAVTPTLLWEYPTVRELAGHLGTAPAAPPRTRSAHPLSNLL